MSISGPGAVHGPLLSGDGSPPGEMTGDEPTSDAAVVRGSAPRNLLVGVSPPPSSEVDEDALLAIEPHLVAAEGYTLRFDSEGCYETAELGGGRGVDISRETLGREPSFVVESGKPVTVVADGKVGRLLEYSYRQPETVELSYRLVGGGEAKTALIYAGEKDAEGRPICLPAELDLPDDAIGKLRLGFNVTYADGTTSSDWGPHFDALIAPEGGATIFFDEGWNESVAGAVRAGEKVQLAYDVDRLRGMVGGDAQVTAFVSFDGKAPLELPLSLAPGPDGESTYMPAVRVPFDAREMSIWFRGSGAGGTEFDSDFGKNYRFEVGLARPDADPTWKRLVLRNAGFPNLTEDNFVGMGPTDGRYNCIAWSVGLRDEWLWPGEEVADFDALYSAHGYAPLDTLDLGHEPGVQKIALYGHKGGDGPVTVTHAAVTDSEGRYLSKLGTEPLIRHDDARSVEGPSYGEVVRVYARRIPGWEG